MAEGVTPQRSYKDPFSKSSGDAEESFCDPCINVGKWVPGEGYCERCDENLCGTCLGVHKNLRLTRGHTILDTNQRRGGQDLCVEVCKTHHPETIKFYCKIHDAPGCGHCMTLNHASCKIDRVQDISDGFQATNEFKLIQQKLDEFQGKFEVLKDALDDNLKDLDTIYNKIQHQITSYRKHIIDYLDMIQKQITDEVAEMKQTYQTETSKLIAKNESIKSEQKEILQKIKHDSDVNVNSIFVVTKQAKQRLGKIQNEITKIERSQQKLLQHQHYVFRPSIEIENLVSANTPLGKLVRKPNVNTTATYRGTINVKTRTDKGDCRINDCTLLGPYRMVVTDGINKNIKLIGISNQKVISSYKTSVQPWGVTALNTDQVAVTLPEGRKVQLFNVTSTFTKQNEIQLNKECRCIAYKDGMFAVTCELQGTVEILDIQGQILHTIQGKVSRLHDPIYVKFGQDNDTVIVSDYFTSKISVVTFKGQILHTYTHWEGISGFVITPDGVLFVCSQGSKSVHAVSPDFETSKTIINTEVDPKSISYCDSNYRLYIIYRYSNHGKDSIKVYDLIV